MFIYEMHQHTSPCSGCAKTTPEELIPAIKEAGFAGVVLTNHFHHGNTGIDRGLPWEEFCKPYEDDYKRALKIGNEIGVKVLFGIEEGIGKGKEVLIYGITPDFMYDNPDMTTCSREELYNKVKSAGGVMIQAHPFRDRPYITEPREIVNPEFLDGYEIFNRCNNPEDNDLAKEFYGNSGKIFTAGSDCHTAEFENRCGIECDREIKDEKDLADILKSGNYKLYIP